WVRGRTVIKPSIILTGKEIVDEIERFRKVFHITSSKFKTGERAKKSAEFPSTDFKFWLNKYFTNAVLKAEKNGFNLGAHYCRSIYGNASYKIWKNQIRAMTQKRVKSIEWIRMVLGHGTSSLQTSYGYSNIHITINYDPKVFALPPEHM